MRKLGLIVASLFIIVGCAAGLEDKTGGYSGEGRVVSIAVDSKGYSIIEVKTMNDGHIPIIVIEDPNVFPGQDVKVKRNSRGFGSVTAL